MKKVTYKKLVLSTIAMAICSSLSAAETTNAEEEVSTKGIDFEKIVVTGSVGKGTTVMASSVSVSSMSEEQIEIASPRSSAEALETFLVFVLKQQAATVTLTLLYVVFL